VSNLLGKGFYWARTDKRPYLSRSESEQLVDALQKAITPSI